MNSWQNFLQKISAPQLEFEAARDDEKFCRFFGNLYGIEIFKDGLDLILSKLATKQIRFEIKIIKSWDTNQGCYLRGLEPASNSLGTNFELRTCSKSRFGEPDMQYFRASEAKRIKTYDEQGGAENATEMAAKGRDFDQVLKKFEKIILRSFNHNVLAHEMAHACEFSSQISLNETFRQCIGFDMKNRRAQNLALDAQIHRLMFEALKAYPPNQFLSELFARFFELLSLSKAINPTSAFTAEEVLSFFANTHKFIAEIFNPKIRVQIDSQISDMTKEISQEIRNSGSQFLFRDNVAPATGSSKGISWVKTIKPSN